MFIQSKTESVIIPGGCTKYIKAPDVVWNNPFKGKIRDFYDDWLANANHKFTVVGNMKPVLHRMIIELLLKVWEDLSTEMIKASMKSCAVGLSVDGSQDHLISCCKEGKKTEEGAAQLKSNTSSPKWRN